MRRANSSALPPAACQSTTSPFSGRLGNSRMRIRLALEARLSAIAVYVFSPHRIVIRQQHNVGALQNTRNARVSTSLHLRHSRSPGNQSRE